MATDPEPARGMTLRHAFALACGVVGGTVVAASPLGAHTGGGAASVGGGLVHPLTGPDHLLAMLAVGILAVVSARLDRRLLWAVPATFVGTMAVGGAAGMTGVGSQPNEAVIVGSVLALGAAIGVAGRASRPEPFALVAAIGLVAVAGLAHGHAHGVEIVAGTHVAAYVLGFVAATIALHAAGALVAASVRSRPALVTTLAVVIAGAGASLLV